jgi:hypothetical protein
VGHVNEVVVSLQMGTVAGLCLRICDLEIVPLDVEIGEAALLALSR